MEVAYCRTVFDVKCDSCGKEDMDINVEKNSFKEISPATYEYTTKMDCTCGGVYEYLTNK